MDRFDYVIVGAGSAVALAAADPLPASAAVLVVVGHVHAVESARRRSPPAC